MDDAKSRPGSVDSLPKQLLLKGLLAYSAFGAVQVFIRLIRGWRESLKMRDMLADIPSTKGNEEPMSWLKGMRENWQRVNDWRYEICEGMQICKNVGFRWSSGGHSVICGDPAMVRHFLKDSFDVYTKGDPSENPVFFYLQEFLGDGIFTVRHGTGSEDDGKAWAQMRKISSQIFSRKNFNSLMQDVFVEKAEALRSFLSRPQTQQEAVDLQMGFFTFTMDSIMKIFFGEDSNTVMGKENKYGEAFDKAQSAMRRHMIKSLSFHLISRTFLPWPFGGSTGIARMIWDTLSPTHREFMAERRIINAEADRLVQDCLADPQRDNRRDLLALFLQAQKEQKFTTKFVKDMVLNLIIAGRDTTACLLSWMFYEIARNPDVQKRLQEEIDKKSPAGTPMDLKSLSHNELPYLHAVVYESLRLWPPVPVDSKIAQVDDVLPGGWRVPKGTTLVFCPYNMGRDPDRYPEPQAFKPERWIPFSAPPHHEFPVFQAGPRICLGMDMAIFEAKIAAVELLRHLSFELKTGQQITYSDRPAGRPVLGTSPEEGRCCGIQAGCLRPLPVREGVSPISALAKDCFGEPPESNAVFADLAEQQRLPSSSGTMSASAMSAHTATHPKSFSLVAAADDEVVLQAPWYFDCSNHPEWSRFRERFAAFRKLFASANDNQEIIRHMQEILAEANDLGRRYEPTFVKYASDWSVFHLCSPERLGEVPEDLQQNFCFYGFATVQWLGVFGNQHFANVPGMAEWANNAWGFLNDASKFNAMHFLESSGWHVKMVEMAKALSTKFVGSSGYRVSRDAALPSALRIPQLVVRRSPVHTRFPDVRRLKAVAISYHTALLREPLSFWQHMLSHLFEVEAILHILDATAKTPEDELEVVLDCHTGDHKARHHFLRSAQEYHDRFVRLMGNDPELRSADFFMCGEPVLFCRLLAHFGRPVIGYISTPISVYVRAEDRSEWYQQFYEMALDERHIFAATTPLFAEWVAYGTGISLPVIRPICTYTEATYWPKRAQEVLLLRTVSLFWDTECVLNYFAQVYADSSATAALRFRESASLSEKERMGYSTFSEFLAAVIYPYSPSQFWFYELYAMGVPIYMPSRDSLPLYVSQDYSVCPDFEGSRPGHAPHRVHPHSPFDTDDWAAMTYWAAFTDYLTLPHISHFDSVPSLLKQLAAADHQKISHSMQRAHMEHLGVAMSFWSQALELIASLRGVPRTVSGTEQMAGDLDASDEHRDLSTRQPSGGSPARADGAHRLANDGETRQDHPHEYHFDLDGANKASHQGKYVGGSHWWVKLRRTASDPEVKVWSRDCCTETYGHVLFFLLGNSTAIDRAAECASLKVPSNVQVSTICPGRGDYLFVEARPYVGFDYTDSSVAVLMLPEVRVLSRD
ncbi:CYP704C1 [Symbiodinium sp. KB8]|nr:CYP704C1 [Symbiodinium sp. KB8]